MVQPARPRCFGVGIELVPRPGDLHRIRRFYVGGTARGVYIYNGGQAGVLRHRWIRCSNKKGGREMIITEESATESQYTFVNADLGYRIKYGVLPVRADGTEGDWVYSEATPAIGPSFDTAGSPQPHLLAGSNARKLAIQMPSEIVREGDVIQPDLLNAELHNLDRQRTRFEWLKFGRGLVDKQLTATTLNYQVTRDDFMHTLEFRVYPFSLTGHQLPTLTYTFTHPVQRALQEPPVALNPSIEEHLVPDGKGALGTFRGRVNYRGGTEGQSIWRWYQVCLDGTETLVPEATGPVYRLMPQDIGRTIKFEFTPVRSDGVQGPTVTAASKPVSAQAPRALMAELQGSCVEGETITGIYRNLDPSREGTSEFRWYRSDSRNGPQREILTARGRLEYKLTGEDVGHYITFEYTPVNSSNVKGKSMAAVSERIQPCGPSVVGKVALSGGQCMKPLQVLATYAGGSEGHTEVRWQVSQDGGLNWRDMVLQDLNQTAIRPTADEFHSHIQAIVTPVRSDGHRGRPVPSDPILISLAPYFVDTLLKMIRKGTSTVNVTGTDKAYTRWELSFSHQGFRLKVRDQDVSGQVKAQSIRCPWSAQAQITLDIHNDREFNVTGSSFGNAPGSGSLRRSFLCEKRIDRDMVALLFRVFHALGTSEICNEICGTEFSHAWSEGMLRNAPGRQQEGSNLISAAFQGPTQFHPASKHFTQSQIDARHTLIGLKHNFATQNSY
eukprot:NODE_181_length_2549_cov_22.084400_g137_i0.p1 GENE.NODE_181_length_2549_cov_22.084400_g137_i0~~NODE_181_length_2549_cov_22.084400_g137_i0.p1  ORF type:complete len:726 (+),score=186.58 NODE_181_length_2549_cov_22.084400_g137_i0:329-2506(+)